MSEYLVEDEAYQGKFEPQVWKRLLSHVVPYRRHFGYMALSGLLVAIIDVLLPIVIGRLIDVATQKGDNATLLLYGAAYLVLIVALAAVIWWFIVLAGQIATGVAYDLRKAGFAQLQALSFSFYDVRSTGWLVSRLTADCSKLSSLMPWFLLDLVWGSALVLGIVVAMFWIQWQLALFVVVVIPLLVWATYYFQVKLLASSRMIRKTNSQITASFNEAVMGVRTTKSLVREEKNLGEFQGLSGGMFTYSMRNALQSAVYLPLIASLGSVGVGLALWRGGVLHGTGFTLGTLVIFMQYAALLYMPIQEMAERFTALQSAQAAAERVQGLLDAVPEIQDSPEVLARLAAETPDGMAPDGMEPQIDSVAFRGVDFAYKDDEPVLRDFNLEVRRGETIALVGATGSGKSTIVSLLARFYEPTAGEILYNGVDYRQRGLHWLQSQLGVVLQTPHLFRGTIADNIRYGRLDATEEELHEAARKVGAYEFIMRMEGQFEAEVGEGGGRLSVGQRQLIALARAILADPQIFIMDEATSSVDTETEQLIQAGVEALLEGRIAFVIAHRLSTIRNADRILVIDKGVLLEEGDHLELMRQRGHYHHLYTRQFVDESVQALKPAPSTS